MVVKFGVLWDAKFEKDGEEKRVELKILYCRNVALKEILFVAPCIQFV